MARTVRLASVLLERRGMRLGLPDVMVAWLPSGIGGPSCAGVGVMASASASRIRTPGAGARRVVSAVVPAILGLPFGNWGSLLDFPLAIGHAVWQVGDGNRREEKGKNCCVLHVVWSDIKRLPCLCCVQRVDV